MSRTVGLDDVRAAAARLSGAVHRTPLLASRRLDALADRRVYLKAECLQRTGSFKIRGAYNRVSRLGDAEREAGVLTYSSGNHGQAVALAARLAGVRATVVMPEGAVSVKVEAARGYGAEVVFRGTDSAARREYAERRARDEGATLVPPYDHPDIIAGQGTVALEILEAIPELDCLVVPVGGGGLAAGCATAVKQLRPEVRVVGVEPALADDTRRSLAAGRPVRIDPPTTIADGLRAVEPGELTFPLVQRHLDDLVTVDEAAIVRTLRRIVHWTKTLVEPSGAVALAAVCEGDPAIRGRRVCAVATGGNLDPARVDWLGDGPIEL